MSTLSQNSINKTPYHITGAQANTRGPEKLATTTFLEALAIIGLPTAQPSS
jgi:hypothetical protein